MSTKPKKRIAPTLVGDVDVPAASKAFEAAAHKKNPLENAADMIAMRYGIPEEAPKIDEAVFKQNRAIGKKVVPLKEYFEQTAKEFVQKEAEKKEEAARKKREYAKLTPCQRKLNTLKRNLDGYIQTCDRTFSNEALIAMADNAREKASKSRITMANKANKANKANQTDKARGGRKTRKCL
jgi:transketolase